MLMELYASHDVFVRTFPLTERLKARTLRRHQYEALVALFTENMLATGQVDEHKVLLEVTEALWRRCPAYWMPDLRGLKTWAKRKLAGDR